MDAAIRPATTEEDLQAWLAVRNAVDPRPLTLAGLRAERSSAHTILDLVAAVDARTAGAGSVGWGPLGEESGNVTIELWVLPDVRRHGIGGSLFERLVTFAREGAKTRLTTWVPAGNTASISFLERRGLHVDGVAQLGHLGLTTVEADAAGSPDPPTLASFSERPDLERDVYDLDILVRPEIPYLRDEPLPSFDAWHGTVAGDPGFMADLSIIALDAGRVVGAIEIYDRADAAVFIGMTAVHPDTRRRGVGRAMKVEVARRARAAGVRRIETANDGANERIRGLNESLGYVYDPPFVTMRGPVP